jgi:hypothetical protein
MRGPRFVAALAAGMTGAALAAASCTPSSRYREPRAAIAGTGVPSVEATTAALAGEWAGEYDGPLYARRGALGLSLRRVARVAVARPGSGSTADRATSALTGTATLRHGATVSRIPIDSAQVGRGRLVLVLAPFADVESGATIRVRLAGALAADTLGGRLRADGAVTAAAERRGGWRVVRAARPAAP